MSTARLPGDPRKPKPVGEELAHRLGGHLDTLGLIYIGGHHIACRPTGRVVLDDSFQLGWLSDGADLLVRRYSVFVAGLDAA